MKPEHRGWLGSPAVIAFTGAAGSGKSTAAQHLVDNHGFVLVKFAGPLKAMARAAGLTESQIEGGDKEKPTRILQGKTPRQFMQLLGTEFGREMIGPNLWVDLWQHATLQVLDNGGRVVCDDCRFANEAQSVREMGGRVVQLVGRGGIPGGHVSELMDWKPDSYVANDNEPADLARDVGRLVA